ncbi:insulin-like growth factor-binding protein 2 isoform B [Patagioenas fasciata monilis]|uniref:Insulin-like growth factor-binding protein 2 isoform B n=1 Tax=Patagioenas fasciata monilis TaxID=372326 RepID=A0A1V4K681_PATFA|nr:insulin-like growth factor-binding protein 2 isoform B [Patagioenas fasciata monilis]
MCSGKSLEEHSDRVWLSEPSEQQLQEPQDLWISRAFLEAHPKAGAGGLLSCEAVQIQGLDRAWMGAHPVSEDNGDDRSESILAENHVDGTPGILSGAGGRKPIKTGMKELAVMREKVNEQQRQMGKVSKAHHNHEDSKKSRLSTGRTPCQQELDQVLERISTMRLPDERGPLEHLYSLHIPNCDKHGLYNLKQCKMSVNGQRGECWCVDPIHGKVIQGAPTIRGDPECHLFYTAHEQEDRGAHALRSQ